MGNFMFYRVRKIAGKYYLIKEFYDPQTGKKRSISIGNCEKIERLVRGVGFEPTQAFATGASVPRKAGGAKRVFPTQVQTPRAEQVEKFKQWCQERGTSPETCQRYASYLLRPFSKSKWSIIAWKLFAKFTGNRELYEALKTPQSGVDLSVPTADDVQNTLVRACETTDTLCTVYKMLIESGARLIEVVKTLTEYEDSKLRTHNGFFTYELDYIRGSKASFYIFTITKPSKKTVSDKWVRNWAAKNHVTNPKYIRKFVSTQMATLGIPENVINFIQGRVPRDILSRHYLNLYALALQHYPRYAAWLRANVYDKIGG